MSDQESPASIPRGCPAAFRLTGVLLLAGAFGCARAGEASIEVACTEIALRGGTRLDSTAGAPAATGADQAESDGGSAAAPALGVDDPLELVVRIDSVPPGPGSLLIRVDGLADPGVVAFSLPPMTAAAAAMALTAAPRFQGCAAMAAEGIELRAPVAPLGKAWVRVSTDRPVRVRAIAAGRSAEALVVLPGSSGTVAWGGTP